MIREFWVENYRSIKDRQVLSFLAKAKDSELVAEMDDGKLVYKLAVLMGANASGKSNLLYAMDTVFGLMVQPRMNAGDGIEGAVPFVQTADEPTRMFVSFYAGKTRYDYEVEFDRVKVTRELLHYYPNGQKSLFYERRFVGQDTQAEVKFGGSLKLKESTQSAIRENTLNNHSVLAVCRKNAFKDDIAPFVQLSDWIRSAYLHEGKDGNGIVEMLKEAYADDRKRRFFEMMLSKADLNIESFKPVVEDNAKEDKGMAATVENIAFVNSSDTGAFVIPLNLQSHGTQTFVMLLNKLYQLISEDCVYRVDELSENLHNELLWYFINVFVFNSERSQMIMASQETALLARDLLNSNRGAVWFVEKNRETASSEYSRGDSFGLHPNLSLYNAYRTGRLGATPDFGSFFVDLD